MRKSIILIISSMLVALPSNATSIPLDSIKAKMVSFYKEIDPRGIYKDVTAEDDFPNFLIYDRKQGEIAEGKEGIFSFGVFVSHERRHFILVGKDSAEILSMFDPIDQNILKLSEFLESNQRYSKNDALFYIRDVINTYQRDKEMLESFKGIIK